MALGSVLSLAIMGGLGYLAAQQTVDRSLEAVLEQNLRYPVDLGGPAVDLNDADLGPEREALRNLYFQSIFNDQVFLLDPEGRLFLSELQETGQGEGDLLEPAYVQRAMRDERLTVSSVHYREPSHRPWPTALAGCTAADFPVAPRTSGPHLHRARFESRAIDHELGNLICIMGTHVAARRSAPEVFFCTRS